MRDLIEIKNSTCMKIKKEMKNGIGGSYYDMKNKKWLNFIFSWNMGWEHLSVSTPSRTPTWDDMCLLKDVFWNTDEVCMQIHPQKEKYVNNHKYCLHIWKPINQNIPTPPTILVGIRPKYIKEDILALIEYAKANNIEFDEEIQKEIESLKLLDIEKER